MSEPDHFSTVLDVEAHEQFHDHSGDDGEHDGADGYGDFHERESEAPKKKSLPTPVLILGGMVVFIALGGAYQHFFGAKPQSEIMSAPPANPSADTGGMIASNSEPPTSSLPSPARPGGLVGAAANPPPLPADMRGSSVDPIGPVPSAENARLAPQPSAAVQIASAQPAVDMAGNANAAPNPGSASINGSTNTAPAVVVTAATATPAAVPENATAMISAPDPSGAASMPVAPVPAVMQAQDPKDAEIAQLKAELKAANAHHGTPLRHVSRRLARAKHVTLASDAVSPDNAASAATTSASATPDTAASDTAAANVPSRVASNPRHVRHAIRGKQAHPEVLAGYHIKQVIPGQGWIEDEQTGKQQVVSVGDRIGGAQVTRIDPDTYRIETTAGAIQ